MWIPCLLSHVPKHRPICKIEKKKAMINWGWYRIVRHIVWEIGVGPGHERHLLRAAAFSWVSKKSRDPMHAHAFSSFLCFYLSSLSLSSAFTTQPNTQTTNDPWFLASPQPCIKTFKPPYKSLTRQECLFAIIIMKIFHFKNDKKKSCLACILWE